MDTYLRDLRRGVHIGVAIIGEADRCGGEEAKTRHGGAQVLQAVAANLQAHLNTATDKTRVGHAHWLNTFDVKIGVVAKVFATLSQVALRLCPEESPELASWSDGDWLSLASCLVNRASVTRDPAPHLEFLERALAQVERVIAAQRIVATDLNNEAVTQLRGTLCAVADHLTTLLADDDVPQRIKDRLAKIYEIAGWGTGAASSRRT
ncbi:hypothetical protein [Nannocystis pusilla]|uniref:hypothetical protein n=1 Tax=Nannocystis pusilla TaxID=889268 RepID=UPI003B793CF6